MLLRRWLVDRSSTDLLLDIIFPSEGLWIWLWLWSGLPALPALEVLLPSPTSLTVAEPPFRLVRLDWLSMELLDPAPFLSSSNMRMISFSSTFSLITLSWLVSRSFSFCWNTPTSFHTTLAVYLPNPCHSLNSFFPFCRSSSKKQHSSLSSWLSSCSFWLTSFKLRISWRCTCNLRLTSFIMFPCSTIKLIFSMSTFRSLLSSSSLLHLSSSSSDSLLKSSLRTSIIFFAIFLLLKVFWSRFFNHSFAKTSNIKLVIKTIKFLEERKPNVNSATKKAHVTDPDKETLRRFRYKSSFCRYFIFVSAPLSDTVPRDETLRLHIQPLRQMNGEKTRL